MKPKLKHCLLVIAAILMLCSCEEKPKTYIDQTATIWVDTINIHGESHEILLRSTNPSGQTNAGGMMHSPECWCGKGGGR